MTDLVQKLVGALEECLDDSRSVLADMEQKYGTNYRQDRLESQRQCIAAAAAALSEAKAGGWVAVPNQAVAFGIATQSGALHSVKKNIESAHRCAERWRQKQAEKGFADWKCQVIPLAPLPAPPAQRGEG